MVKRIFLITLLGLLQGSVMAQSYEFKKHYIGILPSFLAEPYDTINALEVNVAPLVYEIRFGQNNQVGIHIRPMVNYRFYKPAPGISQVGGTILLNRYFLNLFKEDSWLKFQAGLYSTYTYNRLDRINTITVGLEPGLFMILSDRWSMSLNIQPGINYYPDAYSREFVNTASGFKSHFGIMFHIGANF